MSKHQVGLAIEPVTKLPPEHPELWFSELIIKLLTMLVCGCGFGLIIFGSYFLERAG